MHDRGRAMTSKTALKKLRELLDAETYAAVIGLHIKEPDKEQIREI